MKRGITRLDMDADLVDIQIQSDEYQSWKESSCLDEFII